MESDMKKKKDKEKEKEMEEEGEDEGDLTDEFTDSDSYPEDEDDLHGDGILSRRCPSVTCVSWIVCALMCVGGIVLLSMGSYCTLEERSTLERCDVMSLGGGIRFTWVYVNAYNISHAVFCILSMIVFYADILGARKRSSVIGSPKGFRWGTDSGFLARDMLTLGCTALMVSAICWEYGYNHVDWMLFVSELMGVITNTVLSIYAKNVTIKGSRLFRKSKDDYILLERDPEDGKRCGPKRKDATQTDRTINTHWGSKTRHITYHGAGRVTIQNESNPVIESGCEGEGTPDERAIDLEDVSTIEVIAPDDERKDVRWDYKQRMIWQRLRDIVLLICIAMMVHNGCYLIYDFSAMSIRSFDPERSYFEKEINRSLSWAVIYYRLIIFTYFYKKLFHKDKMR